MRAGSLIDTLFDIKLNVVAAALINRLVSATVVILSDNVAGMLTDGLDVDTFIIPASSEEYLFFR